MSEQTFLEVKVAIIDSDQKLARKFPVYEPITISHDDPVLRKMVDQTIADFKGDQKDCDINVTIKYPW
jgi:hypothetical protein